MIWRRWFGVNVLDIVIYLLKTFTSLRLRCFMICDNPMISISINDLNQMT